MWSRAVVPNPRPAGHYQYITLTYLNHIKQLTCWKKVVNRTGRLAHLLVDAVWINVENDEVPQAG